MENRKGIAIYGSTGSIGTQTLEILDKLGNFDVITLCCNSNIDLFEKQIRKYNPKYASVINPEKAQELEKRLRSATGIRTQIVPGVANAIDACVDPDVKIVVNSTVGVSGLVPTINFIKHKKDVALANKESLVTGGNIVMPLARTHGVNIYPIDSEHSAIWQCIQGESKSQISKLIITASGGPFRTSPMSMLRGVTPEQALRHPTWVMGKRITIDSATLMNKGFEVIEAKWLFNIGPENIDVVIHPTSIVHSFVQFKDGAIKAQMGVPDMKLPIQYALTYPNRTENSDLPTLNLENLQLSFTKPDMEKYKCLQLAFDAMKLGGTAPAVLNGADEKAVELFLDNKIKFLDIPKLIESALKEHVIIQRPNVVDILNADAHARAHVQKGADQLGYTNRKSISRSV